MERKTAETAVFFLGKRIGQGSVGVNHIDNFLGS